MTGAVIAGRMRGGSQRPAAAAPSDRMAAIHRWSTQLVHARHAVVSALDWQSEWSSAVQLSAPLSASLTGAVAATRRLVQCPLPVTHARRCRHRRHNERSVERQRWTATDTQREEKTTAAAENATERIRRNSTERSRGRKRDNCAKWRIKLCGTYLIGFQDLLCL